MEYWARRRPDWFEYVTQSMLLYKQGAGAAQLYGMPVDCPHWQAAQKLLGCLWLQIEMRMQRNAVRLG